MLEQLGITWIELLAAIAVGILLTVGGTLLTGVWLVKLPADYFCERCERTFWSKRHAALRWAGLALKNLLGAALVVLGIILALPGVPGPGVLTILFGLTLLDFPGKRRAERWLVSQPRVLAAVNRLRARYRKPPIEIEPTYITPNQ
jgi:hypothetical protein